MNEPTDHVETILLTEKATMLGDKHNQYVFRVSRKANKLDIKRAIETLFKKTVVSVNTANFSGKKKRERTANFGRRAHWKKAIVTLKDGDSIDIA